MNRMFCGSFWCDVLRFWDRPGVIFFVFGVVLGVIVFVFRGHYGVIFFVFGIVLRVIFFVCGVVLGVIFLVVGVVLGGYFGGPTGIQMGTNELIGPQQSVETLIKGIWR